jgi:hypothetical protein
MQETYCSQSIIQLVRQKALFDFEASFPVNLFISISTLAAVLQVVAVVVVVIGVSSRLSGCKVVEASCPF